MRLRFRPFSLTPLRLTQRHVPVPGHAEGRTERRGHPDRPAQAGPRTTCRYLVDDFGIGARLVTAVGVAGDALGHHPRVSIGNGYLDLTLVNDDAVHGDDEGTRPDVECAN